MAVVSSGFGDMAIPSDIQSFPRFFLRNIDEHGDKVAVIDSASGRSYTFSELKIAIKKCGSALVKQGLRCKDVFAILLPNMPEYPIVFYGVTSIGGVVTTLNPTYTVDELIYQLRDSGAKYLLTVPPLAEKAKKAASQCGIQPVFVFGEAEGCESFSSLLLRDDGSSFPDYVPVNWKEDLVCLLYSSGTTGLPKGVMLTHYNLIAHATMFFSDGVLTIPESGAIFLGLVPLFHSFGFSCLMGACLLRGGTLVCMTQFDPPAFLNAIQQYKITHLPIVPPIALFLAKHPIVDKYNLLSVIEITCGAAPLGKEVISALNTRLPHIKILRQGYGLTETSPSCTTSPASLCKPGSVGVLLPNLKAKVIDLKTGVLLSADQDGEICVKGPTIMKGYLNKPEATANTIDSDGWLHTGDIGHYDAEGHFYVIDRVKELIKYKGYQVPPAELEAVLLSHPQLVDAAVIGIPDAEAGELPKAIVVSRGGVTQADIQQFVAGRVASHKKLRGGVEFVESIPKNASGKILRRQLRDREMAKTKNRVQHKL